MLETQLILFRQDFGLVLGKNRYAKTVLIDEVDGSSLAMRRYRTYHQNVRRCCPSILLPWVA